MNMYVHIHTGTRPPGLSTSTRFPAFPQVPCRRAHVVIRQDLQEGRCLICLTNACACLRQTGQKASTKPSIFERAALVRQHHRPRHAYTAYYSLYIS